MTENVFSNKLESIKKDIIGTIQSKVETILSDKSDTHFIVLSDCPFVDNGSLCDAFICHIELTDENKVILTDNDQNTYSLADEFLPLEAFAKIADGLTDKAFELEEKEEW